MSNPFGEQPTTHGNPSRPSSFNRFNADDDDAEDVVYFGGGATGGTFGGTGQWRGPGEWDTFGNVAMGFDDDDDDDAAMSGRS